MDNRANRLECTVDHFSKPDSLPRAAEFSVLEEQLTMKIKAVGFCNFAPFINYLISTSFFFGLRQL